MKNSMRAVLEFHTLGLNGSGVRLPSGELRSKYDAPPIQVVLTDDDDEFAIKISDQGGGIPRRDMPRIWSYLYTTTNPADGPERLVNGLTGGGELGVDAAGGHPTNAVGPEQAETPMSGFGYGLPIARQWLEAWGGDLQVVSVPGYGTDAYLYLPKDGALCNIN